MKVLLTGADGQLGKAFQARCHGKGIDLLACGRQQLDITQLLQIEACITAYKPDWIINAAAYTAVDQAESAKEQAYAVNYEGVKYLATVGAQAGIPVLHISTDYVFSGDKETPYQPEDPPNPLNVYGASKLAGEHALLQLHRQSIILRTSWVFSCFGNNFVTGLLNLLQKEPCIKIVNDQIGTPTAAEDLADVIVAIIRQQSHAWGIYHYSNTPPVSRYAFAMQILEQAKQLNVAIKTEELQAISSKEYQALAVRPLYSALDSNKIAQTFHIPVKAWQPFLKANIERLIYDASAI